MLYVPSGVLVWIYVLILGFRLVVVFLPSLPIHRNFRLTITVEDIVEDNLLTVEITDSLLQLDIMHLLWVTNIGRPLFKSILS
jgi:hypothetical protein